LVQEGAVHLQDESTWGRESSKEIAHLVITATEFCMLACDLRQSEISGHANGVVGGHSRSSGEKWSRNINSLSHRKPFPFHGPRVKHH
jgi:hypothetical protein